MCGLAGMLSFAPERLKVTEPMLLAMRETMVHRGPDGAGTWVDDEGRIGLAFRRLAIIDLSDAASQPMCDAEGILWIVFNGEIYNHRELRHELSMRGHRRWKTDHSDTEVILRAFREWGIECLHRFKGMFAFALWDSRERTLWLVRDRIGIKPLYYAADHKGIAFASEIKAILAGPERTRTVNEEAFFHYLSFLTTPAPSTMFAGIDKLPPGTWLRVSADGTTERRRWWDVLDYGGALDDGSERELTGRVMEGLRRSVAYRKVSDVPVGVFLSGGIDSSTNLALFAEGERGTVKAFSIGYQGDHASVADELPYARLMAAQVGAEHHEIRLTQDDLLEFLPRMVELQDEPIADPVCVPVYYVSKLAREHGVTVCQVGEGADELFWGYPRWKAILMLERLNALPVPSVLKKLGVSTLRALGLGEKEYTEYLRRGASRQPVFWGGAEAFTEAAKARLLSPRLRERFRDLTSWEAVAPIRARFESKAWDLSPLSWMTYLDLNMRLPELLLMRVDKMSMGASVEARVPYLDHEFVTLVMSIPAAAKTRGGNLKHLLKASVRGLIPDAIIDRPKQGFAVPIHEWFFDRLGDHARDTLDQFCRETDFFDRNEVLAFADQKKGPETWCLLNFALWWNQYIRT